MEGLTSKKDKKKSKTVKDSQHKELKKILKEKASACKDNFNTHVQEFLDDAAGIGLALEEEGLCSLLEPSIMDDETYEAARKSINTVYNAACKMIMIYQLQTTALLIDMAQMHKTPSPWNGFDGSKTSQNDLIHFNQTLEALFNIKKLCSESMAYLKEGDTEDAHQMHTFSMNADSSKGSASTINTSGGITNKPVTKPDMKKPDMKKPNMKKPAMKKPAMKKFSTPWG